MSSNNPNRDDPNGVDWSRYEQELNGHKATTKPGHFDVPLDDEPQPGGSVVDPPPADPHGRRPIIPSRLVGWQNVKATIRDVSLDGLHRAGFHAIRAPWYGLQATFWAFVGVFRVLNAHRRWWWLSEQYGLRQRAADADDWQGWYKLHREVKATRAWRGFVIIAEAIAVAIGGPIAYALTPWWGVALIVTAAVCGLAHLGRPADRPILTPAVVAGRYRRVNPDIILRAYYAAGLGHPDKPDQQITFGSTMSRDASRHRLTGRRSTCRTARRSTTPSRPRARSRPAWTCRSTRCS